jgi:hypothetical protein
MANVTSGIAKGASGAAIDSAGIANQKKMIAEALETYAKGTASSYLRHKSLINWPCCGN